MVCTTITGGRLEPVMVTSTGTDDVFSQHSHLHEIDDHALGDCTPSSRAVLGVHGMYQAAFKAIIERMVVPFLKVAPI